ncbi:MAG TPA: hypothetical protein VJB61_02040 [Actinomycetota bacterium]
MAAQGTPQKGRPTGRVPEPSRPSTRPNPLVAIWTNWTPHLVVAGRWVVAAATGETGRRVARAVGLTVVLAVLVSTLYDHGEAPRAAAAPAVVTPAAGAGAGPGLQKVRRKALVQPGGLRGRDRATAVGERPAAVAADWYAARYGVARARVKPLQQDRLSAREVRVLVMADHGRGRLQTALVRVRKGPDGWRVR